MNKNKLILASFLLENNFDGKQHTGGSGNKTLKMQISEKDIEETKSNEETRIALLKRRKSGSPTRNPWMKGISSPKVKGLFSLDDQPLKMTQDKSGSFIEVPYQTQFKNTN